MGHLLYRTAAVYVALVVLAWVWQRYNAWRGILFHSERMESWILASHPARSVLGRTLSIIHIVLGMVVLAQFVYRSSARATVVADWIEVVTAAWFTLELMFQLVLAPPYGKVRFFLSKYRIAHVVR